MAQAALATAEQGGNELGAATAALRRTMVERQLRPFDVTDVPVLQRFLDIPREIFLPAELAPLAYSDMAIAMKGGAGGRTRTLTPPLVLARLLQGADIRENDKVLDIGGGAGFPAALLAGLAGEVTALECDAELAEQAKANLAAVGAANVRVETGALENGVAAAGPFDVILIHGGVEDGLGQLFEQLAPNGRLLAIATPRAGGGQQVVRYERHGGKAAGERPLFDASAPILPGFAKTPAFAF
jgi:protein-L-isoaspartate(D-aspartate) O-methyltransferase